MSQPFLWPIIAVRFTNDRDGLDVIQGVNGVLQIFG
jgi:hypothetical protein